MKFKFECYVETPVSILFYTLYIGRYVLYLYQTTAKNTHTTR